LIDSGPIANRVSEMHISEAWIYFTRSRTFECFLDHENVLSNCAFKRLNCN